MPRSRERSGELRGVVLRMADEHEIGR